MEESEKAYSNLTNSELKKLLKENNLIVGGTKKELIARLSTYLAKKERYSKLNVAELKILLDKEGIYSTSGKKKIELINLIISHVYITSLLSRIWNKYTLEIVFISPFLIFFLFFIYLITSSAGGWEQIGWEHLSQSLYALAGFTLIITIIIVPLVIVAIGLDKIVNSFKSNKGSQSSIKELGILIGIVVLIWGAIVADKQMKLNEATDNLNEVYDENEEVLEAEGIESPNVEKEYTGYVFVIVGAAILLFYYNKSN